MTPNAHYKLMRLLEANPGMSQRDLARELGMSLGKVNYCVRELIKKGWIKAANFKNSQNKIAYMYLLTPRGLDEKASLTLEFLRIKVREYEALRAEIEEMQREAALSEAGRATAAAAPGPQADSSRRSSISPEATPHHKG